MVEESLSHAFKESVSFIKCYHKHTNSTNEFELVILSTYVLLRSIFPGLQGSCQATEEGEMRALYTGSALVREIVQI